jgi:hypothetical protein
MRLEGGHDSVTPGWSATRSNPAAESSTSLSKFPENGVFTKFNLPGSANLVKTRLYERFTNRSLTSNLKETVLTTVVQLAEPLS